MINEEGLDFLKKISKNYAEAATMFAEQPHVVRMAVERMEATDRLIKYYEEEEYMKEDSLSPVQVRCAIDLAIVAFEGDLK